MAKHIHIYLKDAMSVGGGHFGSGSQGMIHASRAYIKKMVAAKEWTLVGREQNGRQEVRNALGSSFYVHIED